MGRFTFHLLNQSGNTENGKEVVLWVDPDQLTHSITYLTEGIDGSKLSFIYVDGQLADEEQIADSERELTLRKLPSAIKPGEHNVQLVQYEDDTENSRITTFKQQEYTVKEK